MLTTYKYLFIPDTGTAYAIVTYVDVAAFVVGVFDAGDVIDRLYGFILAIISVFCVVYLIYIYTKNYYNFKYIFAYRITCIYILNYTSIFSLCNTKLIQYICYTNVICNHITLHIY